MVFNKATSSVKRPDKAFATRSHEWRANGARSNGYPSGEFVSLISHELRTPLTSVLGYLELVIDNQDLPPECRLEYFAVPRLT